MLSFKKKDEENLDVTSLNELIRTGKNVLKLLFALAVVSIFFMANKVLNDWGIYSGIITILHIISPLFIGFIIAWLLDPLVDWLVKKGASRTIASIGVFVGFIFIITLFFWIVIPSVAKQLQDAVGFVPSIIDSVTNWTDDFFNEISNLYDYDLSGVKESIYSSFTSITENITIGLPQLLVNVGSSILSGSITLLLGIFVGFYMLFDFNNVRKQFLKLIPKKWNNGFVTLTDRLDGCLKSYVQGTIFVTICLFIFQSAGFAIAGLKAPIVFGLVCAVTNIIPYVGPYLGGVPAVIVGFTINPLTGLLTLIAVVISQFLESYVLTPVVMSKTMKLHPVTIIIGLLIFEHFFGIIGMLFSTPIISCLKIIFNFFEEKFQFMKKIRG